MKKNNAIVMPNTTQYSDNSNISDNYEGIKVLIRIPENITDRIRQGKINRIYDILKPKISV